MIPTRHNGGPRAPHPGIGAALSVVIVATLGLTTAAAGTPSASARPSTAALEDACAAGQPYLVTACYYGHTRLQPQQAYQPSAVSVALFRDTPHDRPHYALASYDDIGTVGGLAYSQRERTVYAAAYHKRQLPFGPLGAGGIYRIDLQTGQVAPFVAVPDAGTDRHEHPIRGTDDDAAVFVGRTSLGDLDLNADHTELFVVNMADRRIYRYRVPGGDLLGSFAHGAADEEWADEARPMGLAVRNSHVYHGLVHSAEFSKDRTDLRAHIYRSQPDGTEMSQIAEIPLTYERGFVRASPHLGGSLRLNWQYWRDGYLGFSQPELEVSVYPQPMVADITFDSSGNMVVGLRDRRSDTSPRYVFLEQTWLEKAKKRLLQLGFSIGVGDVLHGKADDGGWTFDTTEEHYDDDLLRTLGNESAQGGLAKLPTDDTVVAGSYVDDIHRGTLFYGEGFRWYDSESGEPRTTELVCNPTSLQRYRPVSVPSAQSIVAVEQPTGPTHLGGAGSATGHTSAARAQARPSSRTAAAHRQARPTARPTVPPTPLDMTFIAPPSVGDVEAICASAPDIPTPLPPSPTPTATVTPPATPTATSSPAPSATQTPRPTATSAAAYLPLLRNAP